MKQSDKNRPPTFRDKVNENPLLAFSLGLTIAVGFILIVISIS